MVKISKSINKVIGKNEKCIFYFYGKKPHRLFGQPNNIIYSLLYYFPYEQLYTYFCSTLCFSLNTYHYHFVIVSLKMWRPKLSMVVQLRSPSNLSARTISFFWTAVIKITFIYRVPTVARHSTLYSFYIIFNLHFKAVRS